jgi:chorismate lyase
LYAVESKIDQSNEPCWRAWRCFTNDAPATDVRSWLLDEGSLTARLSQASGNRLRVQVLSQCWQRPLPSERRALGLGLAERALVREVALECAGEPWVYARSILPLRTLRGELRHLRRFGSRSLGALLFSSRGLSREPFELARVPPSHPWLRATPGAGAVWARRSLFRLRGRPLLVQEMFLPACRLGSL